MDIERYMEKMSTDQLCHFLLQLSEIYRHVKSYSDNDFHAWIASYEIYR